MYKKGEKFFKDNATPTQRTVVIKGEQALINFGLENGLYDPEIDGLSSDDLEEIFCDCGENTYNSLIQEIELLVPGHEIPLDVKNKICIFMAAMRVRTPQFKREMEDMDGTYRKYYMALKYGSMTPQELINFNKKELKRIITLDMAKKIIKYYSDKNYELKYPKVFFIKMALEFLEVYADIFCKMTITIVKSDQRYFISSDNPVVFFVPRDKVDFHNPPRALVSPFTEMFFPLSKNLAAHFTWRKDKERVALATRKIVDVFNYNLSYNSFDFIFSPMKMNSLDIFTKKLIGYPFKFLIN